VIAAGSVAPLELSALTPEGGLFLYPFSELGRFLLEPIRLLKAEVSSEIQAGNSSQSGREESSMRKALFLSLALIVCCFILFGSVPVFGAGDPDLGAKVDKLFEKWNSIDSPGAAVAQLNRLPGK